MSASKIKKLIKPKSFKRRSISRKKKDLFRKTSRLFFPIACELWRAAGRCWRPVSLLQAREGRCRQHWPLIGQYTPCWPLIGQHCPALPPPQLRCELDVSSVIPGPPWCDHHFVTHIESVTQRDRAPVTPGHPGTSLLPTVNDFPSTG